MTGSEKNLEEKKLLEAAKSLPITSHVDMRIDREGRWFHDGGQINRKGLVRLFSTVLKRDDAGKYWLVTPVEKAQITVEDVPFIIPEMKSNGMEQSQVISFRNNVDDWFELNSEHSIRLKLMGENKEPTPYVLVREGLEARLLRSVYYQLVDLAEVVDEQVGVWSGGVFHVIGMIE